MNKLLKFYNIFILSFFLLSIFLVIISVGYKNHIYTSNFVDEEDNFTIAKYLLSGERLYTDIFSHHQPIPYFISEIVQGFKSLDNVSQLIKWSRYFVIFWTVFWCLLLFFRFRFQVIFFILVFELTKLFLLGHTFLAEALVVYPLIYIFLLVFNRNVGMKEMGIAGALSAFIFFTLAPLWPIIFFLACLLLYKRERVGSRLFYFVIGFFLISILIFRLISFNDYFHETIYINLKYYIKSSFLPSDFLKAIFSPLLFLISDTSLFLKVVSLEFLFVIIISIIRREYASVSIILFTLGLANIRYVTGGFHLLPWYSLVLLSTGYLITPLLTKFDKKDPARRLLLVVSFCLIFFIFYIAKDSLFARIDVKNEEYVHYSQQYDFGKAVEIMSARGDDLMVVPVEPLILWQSDVAHFTKYTYYYTWMSDVPEIRNEIIHRFEVKPPTFFYLDTRLNEGGKDLVKFLKKYQNVKRNNMRTNLFIRKDKARTISGEQLHNLQFFDFSI